MARCLCVFLSDRKFGAFFDFTPTLAPIMPYEPRVVIGPTTEENEDWDDFVRQLTGCQDDLIVYIRTLCGDYHVAADIRQEVNQVLWRKRRIFQPGSHFRRWAYRIADLEVKAYFRQRKRRPFTTLDPELIDSFADELPEQVNELPERRRALAGCLKQLAPRDLELLRHRYWSGAALEVLAQAEGRSVGTLKARLFQVRSALRVCIREHLAEPSP